MKISNILDKYFKVTVINMLTDLQKSAGDLRENTRERDTRAEKETLRTEEYTS